MSLIHKENITAVLELRVGFGLDSQG